MISEVRRSLPMLFLRLVGPPIVLGLRATPFDAFALGFDAKIAIGFLKGPLSRE